MIPDDLSPPPATDLWCWPNCLGQCRLDFPPPCESRTWEIGSGLPFIMHAKVSPSIPVFLVHVCFWLRLVQKRQLCSFAGRSRSCSARWRLWRPGLMMSDMLDHHEPDWGSFLSSCWSPKEFASPFSPRKISKSHLLFIFLAHENKSFFFNSVLMEMVSFNPEEFRRVRSNLFVTWTWHCAKGKVEHSFHLKCFMNFRNIFCWGKCAKTQGHFLPWDAHPCEENCKFWSILEFLLKANVFSRSFKGYQGLFSKWRAWSYCDFRFFSFFLGRGGSFHVVAFFRMLCTGSDRFPPIHSPDNVTRYFTAIQLNLGFGDGRLFCHKWQGVQGAGIPGLENKCLK